MSLRKVYEITGFLVTLDGGRNYNIICVSCYNEQYKEIREESAVTDTHPIFLGDEWDYQPTCDYCNEKIDVNLI